MNLTIKFESYLTRPRIVFLVIYYTALVGALCISYIKELNPIFNWIILLLSIIWSLITYFSNVDKVTVNIPSSKITPLSKPNDIVFHMEDGEIQTFGFAGKTFTPEDVIFARVKIKKKRIYLSFVTKSGDFVTVKITSSNGSHVWTTMESRYFAALANQSSMPHSDFDKVPTESNYFEIGKQEVRDLLRRGKLL